MTSFWLIPAFDTDDIVLGGAAVLLALAAAVFVRRGKLWAATSFGVLLLPGLGLTPKLPLPPNIHVLSRTRSFYGLVDLLAIAPAYLAVLFPAGRFLIALRVLRVIRVFRDFYW